MVLKKVTKIFSIFENDDIAWNLAPTTLKRSLKDEDMHFESRRNLNVARMSLKCSHGRRLYLDKNLVHFGICSTLVRNVRSPHRTCLDCRTYCRDC